MPPRWFVIFLLDLRSTNNKLTGIDNNVGYTDILIEIVKIAKQKKRSI